MNLHTRPSSPVAIPPKIILPGDQSLILIGDEFHSSAANQRPFLIGLKSWPGVKESMVDDALTKFVQTLAGQRSFDIDNFRMLALIDRHCRVPSGELMFVFQSILIGVPNAMPHELIKEIANQHISSFGEIKVLARESWETEVHDQMLRTWIGPDFYPKLLANDLTFLPELLEGEI